MTLGSTTNTPLVEASNPRAQGSAAKLPRLSDGGRESFEFASLIVSAGEGGNLSPFFELAPSFMMRVIYSNEFMGLKRNRVGPSGA